MDTTSGMPDPREDRVVRRFGIAVVVAFGLAAALPFGLAATVGGKDARSAGSGALAGSAAAPVNGDSGD
jgi:hypothetical protein